MSLPAGVISISTPSRSSSGSSAAASRPIGVLTLLEARPRRSVRRRCAAEDARRTVALGDQAQAAAAAGEQPRGDLLEVARGGLEHLLEALPDLPVGVGDQLVQLAQCRLEIVALALELLDVGERLLVLGLSQRVDRSELLAPAGQPLEPVAQRLALVFAQLDLAAGSASSSSRLASCPSSCSHSCARSRTRWRRTSALGRAARSPGAAGRAVPPPAGRTP